MNLTKNILIVLALTISSSGFTQTLGKINGGIKDGGNQKIIDAATVSLLKAKDSSLVKTSVTIQSSKRVACFLKIFELCTIFCGF